MNEPTLEMTLGLQGGMKEDEMVTSAGSAEDRNMRRKHTEIGETQLSDDTKHVEGKWKAYCRNCKRIPWKIRER